jgi:hypothetical protein
MRREDLVAYCCDDDSDGESSEWQTATQKADTFSTAVISWLMLFSR